MTETLTTIQSAGIVLSTAAQDPLVITSSGGIRGPAHLTAGAAIAGVAGTAWTISNAGSITGSYQYAVSLASGGSIANANLMSGVVGIAINGATGTVSNSGTVLGGTSGVSLDFGGLVTNYGTILGGSKVGVYVAGASGTVFNAGTIGGGTVAVQFKTTQAARLVETADAVLLGTVSGGSLSNTLELASSTAGSIGTIAHLSASFVGFQTIDIDSTADWQIGGATAFAGTLGNSGTLAASLYVAASSILNTGIIRGELADSAVGAAVVNQGSIFGSGFGIDLSGGGRITNTGLVTNGTAPAGQAVRVSGGSGSVVNSGSIISSHYGLVLTSGGSIGNSGIILGAAAFGVYVAGTSGTVVNSGTIGGSIDAVQFTTQITRLVETADASLLGLAVGSGPSSTLELAAGTLGRGGTISGFNTAFTGFNTIDVDSGATWSLGTLTSFTGTLDNLGTLSGAVTTDAALFINGAGGSAYSFADYATSASVVNTGVITTGVSIAGGSGTVINSGSIGGGGLAIAFATTLSARLVETADAILSGIVSGGSLSNTLELAASTLGQVGSIANVGSAFINFQTIDVDAGASWSIASLGTFAGGGTIDLLGAGATIALGGATIVPAELLGFMEGETIVFSNLAFVAGETTALLPGNTLDIDPPGSSFDLELDPDQNFTGMYFHLTADGAGTQLAVDTVPCFCRGTLIQTDRGDVPVEALAVGDRVITLSGAARAIHWIGVRRYHARFAARNPRVQPVLIRAGALARDVPRRDLWLSQLHALYLDGLLVPAAALLNGQSILLAAPAGEVAYYHVELATHDVILAEGTPAETFIDEDSRAMFHNAGDRRSSTADACAPRVEEGFELEIIRRRLAVRARSIVRRAS